MTDVRELPAKCPECQQKDLLYTFGRRIVAQCRKCGCQMRVMRPDDTDPDIRLTWHLKDGE